MRLVYADYNIDITILENKINVFVVENPHVFALLLEMLIKQLDGDGGGFVLSQDDKIISICKNADIIFNPFCVDCNEKRIQTKIYQELSAQAKDNFFVQTEELNSQIVTYLEKLTQTLPYHLTFGMDCNISGLLKLYNVEIEKEGMSLLEKVTGYLRALHQICHIELVFLVNIKSYLSKDELIQLYEFSFYEKIHLFLLERYQKTILPNENVCILDEDLCIINME